MTALSQGDSQPPRLTRIARAFPADLAIVRLFGAALAVVLVGYMAMGRGFAHAQLGPAYVGDAVFVLGIVAGLVAIVRRRVDVRPNVTVWLLVLFMLLGVIRTVPYLENAGIAALRDGVLWGYALFALLVLALADRAWLAAATRLYGWVVPIFALWLPVCWLIFQQSQVGIDAASPGSNHPLVFFKAGDMAIHAAGALSYLVIAPSAMGTLWALAARAVIAVPLTWTVFLSSAASRGAMLGALAGLGTTVLATRKPMNWLPVAAAALVVFMGVGTGIPLNGPSGLRPAPTPTATASPGPSPTPSPTPVASPTATPTKEPGRPISVGQVVENIGSIFGPASDENLDGTRAFRLAWWSKIVGYTVFGDYFWTGKGFGINLADADGFQPTADHSLRAPHNSHMTVLARMGVPGFVLWVLLQVTFLVGLIRAIWIHRRRGEQMLAGIGAWVLVVWAAMMVVTSFDPYLEGPQGGIWFWTVFGLGLVVTRMGSRPATS